MILAAVALQLSGGCYQVDNQTRCDSFAGGLIASAPREDPAEVRAREAARTARRATKLARGGKCSEAREIAQRAQDAELSASLDRLCAPAPQAPPLG